MLPLCPIGSHWQLWAATLGSMTTKYPEDTQSIPQATEIA